VNLHAWVARECKLETGEYRLRPLEYQHPFSPLLAGEGPGVRSFLASQSPLLRYSCSVWVLRSTPGRSSF
jgi:hypothetical protein